jgi:hypothetical protein
MIKKKILSEFIKFRTTKHKADASSSTSSSTTTPSPPQNANKSSIDASFHNNLGKITSWTTSWTAAIQEGITFRSVLQLLP